MIVAQRFIAGNAMITNDLSPVGTNESCLSAQSSLRDFVPIRRRYPSDKSLGYCHSPLRGTARRVRLDAPSSFADLSIKVGAASRTLLCLLLLPFLTAPITAQHQATDYTPDELHQVAQDYTNKARQAQSAPERERAFVKAGEQYRAWIKALERIGRRSASPKTAVEIASARVEYAGMLMGLHAAGELDRFEVTAGHQGDREKLSELLGAAREQYRQAEIVITPLYDALYEREDELLAAGIYDAIIRLKLDITFNQGWANYYLGLIESQDELEHGTAFRLAEQSFQQLLDSGRVGQMLPRCHLGLALSQRELKRYDAAERNFVFVLQEETEAAILAQARYELARCYISSGKYAEARTTLRSLLEKDVDKLPPEERVARFYINLGHLWEANSYLIEAEAIRAQMAGSTAKKAILRRAQGRRATGLAKLNRLARRGGSWPAVVQVHIAASINLEDDPATLSPIELLYTARQFCDAQRHAAAAQRLQEAVSRPMFQKSPAERTSDEKELGGQILIELGRCYYRLDQMPAAAETFERLAHLYRSHELAPQAATFAYQLWAQIAQKSKQKEHYDRLATTLLNLIQSFPDHPELAEATWLFPVALQAAGRYSEAADEFAKVPSGNKHWEEAQFRRCVCRRLALEAEHGSQPGTKYAAAATRVAEELSRYAVAARARAAKLTPTEAHSINRWSAEALVNAAELLVNQSAAQYESALQTVAEFESQYPASDLLGRVLTVRIQAYRGLRKFAQATQILEQYLQTTPPEQTGALLSSLARGMQEEVERLQETGQTEAAHRLAADSLNTFTQLEKWLRQDAKRLDSVPLVTFRRAQMLYISGQSEPARQLMADLLKQNPRNGNYQRLYAQILTAQLPEQPSSIQLEIAMAAWTELLKDTTLRKRAPERYWEARYHWLTLLLRAGKAAEVEHAIQQDQVWHPNLGGPPWQEKLLSLRNEAHQSMNIKANKRPNAKSSIPAP